MTDAFTAALTLYALVLALSAAVHAARDTRPRALDAALTGLAALVAVRAVLDAATLLTGHRPAQPTVHAAYLVASALLLPLVLRAAAHDRDRWSTALCAAGALISAVLLVRLQATWRAGAG
ncbi:hypothetical protein RKE29_11605 [Streptomyces sp. B1866]|uniref:hypothetical protein n=1 Tax=Streptomyces sp. B1866 TaxID=3075431 RepID=UPI002890A0A9|nr:hypothetical protein [Streptomyces sp. B1866]MDT3397284.1 hypothetical protein [Streptomyces sp. B1866]